MNAQGDPWHQWAHIIYRCCHAAAQVGKELLCLNRLDTCGRFSATFYKRDNFCDFLFAFSHTSSLLKMPVGSKFFPFRVDPFSEGRENTLTVSS